MLWLLLLYVVAVNERAVQKNWTFKVLQIRLNYVMIIIKVSII